MPKVVPFPKWSGETGVTSRPGAINVSVAKPDRRRETGKQGSAVQRPCAGKGAIRFPLAGSPLAPLTTGTNVRGLLVVAPRRRTAAAEKAALPALLSLAAHTLALRLELEAVRAECASLEEPALLGEAAGALTHDLNNHLNSMV